MLTMTGPAHGATEPLYDLVALDRTPLDAQVISHEAADGIVTEEISFVSEIRDGQPSVITGKLVMPEGATRLPAIIGYADAGVARRGYVGLAVDYSAGSDWYTVRPTPRRSSMYRSVVALIRAVSYLRTRPEVDPEAIGVTGISINGMFAVYLAGVDPRIKATVSQFGCGHILEGWRWGRDLSGIPAADLQVFRETLDPAVYQAQIHSPVLFAGGTNDFAFFLPIFERSYREVPGEKRLSLLAEANHRSPEGMNTGQPGFWAWFDRYLKGEGADFPRIDQVTARARDGKLEAVIKASGPAPMAAVTVAYSPEAEGEWRSRLWGTVAARREDDSWVAEIPVEDPNVPMVYFASVRDERGYTVSLPSAQIDPRELGVAAPTAVPAPRGALYGYITPEPAERGYDWLDGDQKVPWLKEDGQWVLPLTSKPDLETVVRLDALHAPVRWMHGRPHYRLKLEAQAETGARLWIGLKGRDWESGTEVTLGGGWQPVEFAIDVEGDRRFTVVPVFKVPAGGPQVKVRHLEVIVAP
jgi:dienelactone hydrolase